ncbi:hypothetical protein PG997_001445 [Apiospora hydei]|uniref:Uncharacterized protein n=1 Tax=Apiospora hydei TaxID=1337664 RepID=A0ABR1XDI8_9PEZI
MPVLFLHVLSSPLFLVSVYLALLYHVFYLLPFAALSLYRVKIAISLPVETSRGDANVVALLRSIETMTHPSQYMPSSSSMVWLATTFRDVFTSQSLGLKALTLGVAFGSHVKGVSGAPVSIMEREVEIVFSIISICATIAVGIGVAKWQDTRNKARDTQRHHREPSPEARDNAAPVPSLPGNSRQMGLVSGAIPMLPLIPPMSTVAFPEPVFRVHATSAHKQWALLARHLPVMDVNQIQQHPPS